MPKISMLHIKYSENTRSIGIEFTSTHPKSHLVISYWVGYTVVTFGDPYEPEAV